MTHNLNKKINARGAAKTVVYIPASMKPPHVGHVNMIRAYAFHEWQTPITQIKVIISDPKKQQRTLDNGHVITADAAKAALELLLRSLLVTDVAIHIANNPMQWLFDDVVTNADEFKRAIVCIGGSTKDNTSKYDSVINSMIKYMHTNDINQQEGEQTLFADPKATLIKPIESQGEVVNASDIRTILPQLIDASKQTIIAKLRPYLPRTISDLTVLEYFDIIMK